MSVIVGEMVSFVYKLALLSHSRQIRNQDDLPPCNYFLDNDKVKKERTLHMCFPHLATDEPKRAFYVVYSSSP